MNPCSISEIGSRWERICGSFSASNVRPPSRPITHSPIASNSSTSTIFLPIEATTLIHSLPPFVFRRSPFDLYVLPSSRCRCDEVQFTFSGQTGLVCVVDVVRFIWPGTIVHFLAFSAVYAPSRHTGSYTRLKFFLNATRSILSPWR